MKKITLSILALCSAVCLGQDSSALDSLLDRYDNLPSFVGDENTLLQEHFTKVEREILNEHFLEERKNRLNNLTTKTSQELNFFYGVNSRNAGNGEFGRLASSPPYDSFDLVNETFVRLYGDDLTPDGTLYAMDKDTFELVTIDRITGGVTTIGPLTNIRPGTTPSGLSYNFTNGITYVTTTDSNNSYIYSIDLATGTLTEIGNLQVAAAIWLAIDNDGNAFTADIDSDRIYTVNLDTGISTPMTNSLGIDINFPQDATYDHINNILYMAAYEGGGVGGIYTVDTTTGSITFIGSTEPLAYSFSSFTADDGMTLSIEENNFNEISIYPNPTTDHITIDNLGQTPITEIGLYTISGTEVFTTPKVNTIDMSGLANGVYILKIMGKGNVSKIEKVIKI